MKKFYPLLVFLIITIIFFSKFIFLGKLPIPSDTIIGLYHPFRDVYATQYPNGIAFKNALVTDPVRQQYPWRNLAISLVKMGQVPLWNPYNFSGAPLAANFQTGIFYPLNILFFLLPFTFSWSILVVLQPLLAGIFMYYYLRRFQLHPLGGFMGGICFMFCGFSVAWMEWGTIMQTALWFPLILLAKEYLIEKRSIQWMLILIFAEVSLLFAGHLQTFFYAFVVSTIYLVVRLCNKWCSEKTDRKKNLYSRLMTFFITGGIFALITAIQWFPTIQFILLSARNVDQANWQKIEWFIPYQHLIQFIAPDFFGNPTTLNYWGTWNYGEFVGYIGIAPLLFAIYALLFRRDKKVLYSGLLVFIALLFSLPTFIAKIPYQLQIPFLASSQPTRLLFLIDFGLCFLAACGVDYFLKLGKKIYGALGILVGLFVIVWGFVFHIFPFPISLNLADTLVAKHNLYLPTILLGGCFILLLSLLPKKNIRFREILMLLVIAFTILDLFRFFDKFTPFTEKEYLFPQTKTIDFLKKQPRPYRIMTTDSRIFPPNFSVQYGIESIDGYDPLYLQRYGELVIASERGKPDISGPFGFNRIITPHNYDSPIIDLLNVSYVVSLDELNSQKLVKVFQEGQTKVYKNLAVMPRAFFIETVVPAKNKQQVIETIFKGNLKNRVAVEDVDFSTRSFTKGSILSESYKPERVEFTTETEKQAFFVLSDINYPSWKASIDSQETTIYQTDYTFRGIIVPPGKHTVTFSVSLF